MGEKRQYDDEAGASANKRYKGAHRQHPDFKKNTPRPESNNWAKKRVRTIERRLRNPDGLPGHVQVEMRRELAALNDQLEGKQEKKQRSTMISKYHMIRFFERRKAERLQKQLTKRLRETSDADERAEIETDLAIAEIDNLYARYYPFMDAYISLYPKSKDSKDKEDKEEKNEEAKDATEKYGKSSAAAALRAPRPAMWQLIKTTSQEGGVKALEKIRDRPASGNQALTGEDIGEIAAAKEKKDKKAKSDKKEKKEKSEKKDKKEKKDKSEKVDKADKVEKKDKKEKKKAEESESEEEAVPKGIDVAGDDSDEEGGFFE